MSNLFKFDTGNRVGQISNFAIVVNKLFSDDFVVLFHVESISTYVLLSREEYFKKWYT